MATLVLNLDDGLNAALEALCAREGRDKAALLTDILRRHLDSEELRQCLSDPELKRLYDEQLAAEDVALAEEGMAEYEDLLREADRP
jgi:plasmid stability protein